MPGSSDFGDKKQWLLVALAAAIAIPLWNFRGSLSGPGTVIDAPITLITSDRDQLSCALSRTVQKYRCAFEAPDKPWSSPPTAAETLAPYLTTHRQMFLIPGLFEQSALQQRYEREPPRGLHPSRLRRFTANCKLRLLEKVEGFHTRWARAGTWGRSSSAWVAEPLACEVDGR
jgi:hypothetical protein